MTTENIHPENRDVDTSVVESALVSETGDNLQEPTTQAASDVTVPAEQETEASSIPETSENPQGSITQAASDVTIPARQETAEQPIATSTQAETFHEMQEASPQTTETQAPAAQTGVEERLDTQPVQTAQEEIVRPFTDFIEEFRQSESHQSPSEPFPSLLPTQEQTDLTTPWANTPPESTFQALENTEMVSTIEVMENVQPSAPTTKESIQTAEPTSPADQTAIDTTTEQQSVVEQPPAPPARPVSPLLRPAAPRGRGSRHGGHRHREEKAASQAKPIETSSPTIEPAQPETPAAIEPATAAAPAEKPAETAPVELPTPAESTPVEEPARPPRRYRFDRKTPTTSTGSPASAQTPSARPEENKETLGRVTTPPVPRTNNGHAAAIETEPAVEAIPAGRPTEQTAAKHPAIQEAALINETASATVTPSTPIHERHHAQEHQQIKEQPVPVTSSIPPVEPAPEVTSPVAEPVTPPSGEVAPEDMPPLEYSDLQAATSRRRRRRRAGNGGVTTPAATTNAASAAKQAAPEAAPPTVPPSPSPAVPKNGATPQPNQYNIVSGYTVNQMNQGNDIKGPFMGPEPSPARGSTMHTNVRPIRTESQRPHVYPVRGNEPGISANTMNQLVNAVTQALQNQTDRMVAELRHANQAPANVSVTFPPFPSTERVGVFVDVANLLYSARTLRMTIDFGKLLDFLRGNRRLVRAHAYCPTSPQAGDEQMFLQAVKGLGYRITTKNYKTFSSGAKKADLDLDLCMDVVRLVDGKAVDCIVLVSGDSDFMPLLDYCADHGVRVEVAAFDEAMSATLRQSCDLFINLSMLDEIRA